MRSKFPVIWVAQFLFLFSLGILVFFNPSRVLTFLRGGKAPVEVDQPTDALNRWVIRLKEIPAPGPLVKAFFAKHKENSEELKGREAKVRTPFDRDLVQFLYGDEAAKELDEEAIQDHLEEGVKGRREMAETNRVWTAFEKWILSAKPEPDNAVAAVEIKKWIRLIDEIPLPSEELSTLIQNQDSPMEPPNELRLMLLEARQTLPISWNLASDQIRLCSACILAAALFTLLGIMSPTIRRPLARIFVIIAVFWTLAALLSSLGPPDWNFSTGVIIAGSALGIGMILTALRAVPQISTGATVMIILAIWWISVAAVPLISDLDAGGSRETINIVIAIGIVAVMGITNAYYWLVGKNEDPPQDDGGIAARRPPELWTLWLIQFFVLMVNGVLAVFLPSWIAELFVGHEHEFSTTDIVDDSVQFLGVWIIAISLFSYFSLGVGHDWIWQGISVIFSFVFTMLGVTTIIFGSSGEYSVWAFIYGCQGIIFVPITIYLITQKDPWSAANVERAQNEDMKLIDLLIAPRMLRGFMAGRRALFEHGVTVSGTMKVLPEEHSTEERDWKRPPNEFFEEGVEFPIQMRFSNRQRNDDASADIRGCALRCSDKENSPLDLIMSTGTFAPFSSLFDYRNVLLYQNSKRFLQKNTLAREGFAAGMRRAPTSYGDLTYYDHITLEWLTPQGLHYLVRFRIVPKSNSTELQEEQPTSNDSPDNNPPWEWKRSADETRDKDYLRKEISNRLESGMKVRFELQVQFHEPQVSDSKDWYDASLEWDQNIPWHPLAEIVIDRVVPEQDTRFMKFDPSNLPRSLHVPNPSSLAFLTDPRTLGVARYRIAHIVSDLRVKRKRWLAGEKVSNQQSP